MPQCFDNHNVHVHIKHGSFLFKNDEIPTKQGRAIKHMYRVVPQMKRGNSKHKTSFFQEFILLS